MERLPSSATIVRRVEWSDTDASGHHHNGLIVRLIEAAELDLMTEAGVTEEYFAAAPRVRHEITYSAPLEFGQDVTTRIAVERLGTSDVVLRDLGRGARRAFPRALAASGIVVVVHVPFGERRATPWPDTVRAALVPRTDGTETD